MTEEISYSYRRKDGNRIRVTVEPSPTHPNSCRFVVDPPLMTDGAIHFPNRERSKGSPLPEKLFAVEGVTEVLIAGGLVTVTADPAPDWTTFSETVALALRDHIESGEQSIASEILENLPTPESLRERVQEIIDTAINPAVASHGGVVSLLDVKDNTAYLEFGGGCQGCGMVSVTLKHGVERLIRERIPEIGQILDTTDHASGLNPYYAPAGK